jgi:sigma-E factor negative regulatory protein RseA
LTPNNSIAAIPASSTPFPVQVSLSPPVDETSEPTEARLNSYLVNHNGHASRNSMNGMLPYVRMVGYQTNR